jgi:hypothetical protein
LPVDREEPAVPIVACPACGEDEQLTGHQVADGATPQVRLTCDRCGASWARDATRRCGLCGSQDIEGIPTSTLQEKGRGEQWAPSGIRLVFYCWACRGDDVTSSAPRPGPRPQPGSPPDLSDLHRRGS